MLNVCPTGICLSLLRLGGHSHSIDGSFNGYFFRVESRDRNLDPIRLAACGFIDISLEL